MRTCTKCKKELSEDNFNPKTNRDRDGNITWRGLASQCKECRKIQSREWASNNREKERARCRKWVEDNAEYNKERHRIRYWNDPEGERARSRRNYALKPEQYRSYNRKYYWDNVEKERIRMREWQKANPHLCRYYTSKRSALQKARTPKWANEGYIKLWYQFAQMEQERTGRRVHVDHIVPLKGENVCGLHCEDNVQLLFMEDNISKGNRHA